MLTQTHTQRYMHMRDFNAEAMAILTGKDSYMHAYRVKNAYWGIHSSYPEVARTNPDTFEQAVSEAVDFVGNPITQDPVVADAIAFFRLEVEYKREFMQRAIGGDVVRLMDMDQAFTKAETLVSNR